MDIPPVITLIGLIALSLLYPVVYFINLKNTQKSIKKFLTDRGATEVFVEHEFPDYDRDTMSFSLRYIGVKGNKITTRCKVQRWGAFADNEFYWANPLDLEIVQIEKQIPRSDFFELSEQIRSKSSLQLPTFEISTTLPINNSDDRIVMMKYIASFNNVFRCKPDGSIIWQAELPNKFNDVYTNVEWKENQLTAFSRSCISVVLDVETGKIITPQNAT